MKVRIMKSTLPEKKLMALFYETRNKILKVVHFGDSAYEDYTIHGDKKKREAYRIRHKNDRIDQYDTPGALSWYILWNMPTVRGGLIDYKRRFELD